MNHETHLKASESASTPSLIRHYKSKLPSAHMARFALVHIKRHRIISTHAREQCDPPQSVYHGTERHAESGCAEIIHIDHDVAVFVLGRIEG